VRVAGIVQGVGFRYYTRRIAMDLDLGGYVRNISDGSVEAVAEGDTEKVEIFLEQIASGPPAAVVREMKVTETTPEGYGLFDIRF
jgi:acylphosphatase